MSRTWNDPSLVPNTPVQSDVFAGLFYTVGVGGGPTSGYMTYTAKESGAGNYMQIATNANSDYAIGGGWHDDALWAFYPSGVSGYYTWGVKRIPDSYVTYTSDYYSQIVHKSNDIGYYRPGEKWRNCALWGLWKTECPGWYAIGCYENSVSKGFLTYTAEKSPGGNYVQLAVREDHLANYRQGGCWRNDALWGFWPSNYQIHETYHDGNNVRYTATADRVQGNGTVVPNSVVGVEVVKHYLKFNKYNINIISETEDSVIAHKN